MNRSAKIDLRVDGDKTWFGPAWHRQLDGIHVLNLSGSHYEMGRQHGALLRAQVPDSALNYYRTYVSRLMAKNGIGALTPALWNVLRWTVGRRVRKSMPDFAMESLRGLADGAGIPFKTILDGGIMPDTLMWVTARMIEARRTAPAVQHRVQLALGCTSAIAWGSKTQDGRLLHARNLDYHGVRNWPRHTTVAFHTPDEGLKYVSATSAGVVMGGFTAMNAAGLTLTVHQHMFTNGTRLGGTPIATVGDQVMREARTLDDAERILRSYDPIGCWTYLIADGKTNEVLCFEENPDRQTARRFSAEDAFGYANIYLDPELGRTEQDLYPSYWRHNRGRHARVNSILEQGGLDPDKMAAILADEGDSACRLHRSICMLMTVGSVIFRPEDGTLWVARGEAPVSQTPFTPFSLKTGDHAPEAGELTGGVPGDPTRAAAFKAYRDGYLSYFDDQDPRAALGHIQQACALQPEEPLYQFMQALLQLDQGVGDAEAGFDRAIGIGHPDAERVAAFHLWRGRAKDLKGKRDAALRDYQVALAGPADANVIRAARLDMKTPWTKKGSIGMEFSFADVIRP
jgi:tetratricopeptide (TPR) repeat protein